jgi:CHAT domain-containing protein
MVLSAGRGGAPPKAAALRGAQLQFLQAECAPDPDAADFYHHPYFWAAFVLVGDSGPL